MSAVAKPATAAEERTRIRSSALVRGALAALLPTLISGLLSQSLWIPRERLETPDATYYGYVLSSSGSWVSMLMEEPRSIRYIRPDDVEFREVCLNAPSYTIFEMAAYAFTGEGAAEVDTCFL